MDSQEEVEVRREQRRDFKSSERLLRSTLADAAKDISMAIKRAGVRNPQPYHQAKYAVIWQMLLPDIQDALQAQSQYDLEAKATKIETDARNAGILLDMVAKAADEEYAKLEAKRG